MGVDNTWSFPKKEMHIREIQSLRWSLCQWSYDFNFLIDVFLFHHLCHVPFSFVFGFDDLFLFDTFTFPSFVEVIKLKRFKLQPQTFHISFTSSEATISLGDHFTPSTHFSKKKRDSPQRNHRGNAPAGQAPWVFVVSFLQERFWSRFFMPSAWHVPRFPPVKTSVVSVDGSFTRPPPPV